jgi:endothelin-converting enzyme
LSFKGENLADNGGLRAAYSAFEKWLAENPEATDVGKLPGLPLSLRQLFFLGFGQVWCSVATAEADKLTRLNDVHAVSEYRVKGPVSNSREFSKVFNCPGGYGMNPLAKCSLW